MSFQLSERSLSRLKGLDPKLIDVVKKANHEKTFAQARIERAFLKGIGGDCHTKIAAHATGSNPITLKAMYYD